MRIQWYGQSAFLLAGEQTVFIDPFDRPGEALAARGLEFNYAPIEDVTADLLLITHEHVDHNAAVALVRSLAPRLVVPMHYRTAAVNFLEPPDAFLAALGADVARLETSDGDLDELLGTVAAPRVVLFAPPLA